MASGDPFPTSVVPIALLKPHPRNYKQHPDDQVAHIARSIEVYGFYRAVVVARDDTILAGHGVRLAAMALGMESIPVIRLDIDPSEPRALKILAGDNEIGRLAEINDRVLTDLLKEVATADDLLGTGFDAQQLAALLFVTRPQSEIPTRKDAAEWVGLPEYAAEPDRRPKLVISVDSEADRERLLALIGEVTIGRKDGPTWSVWWPKREREPLSTLRFDDRQGQLL